MALLRKDLLEQKTRLTPCEHLNYARREEQRWGCDPPCSAPLLLQSWGVVSDSGNVGLHFSSHPTHPCWVPQLSCLILELSSPFVPATRKQSSARSEVFSSWRMGLRVRISWFFLNWPPRRGTVAFTWVCQGWTTPRYLHRMRHSVRLSVSVRLRGIFSAIASSGAKIIIQYHQLPGEGTALPQPPGLAGISWLCCNKNSNP